QIDNFQSHLKRSQDVCICGSKYSTLNLVNPIFELLKNKIVPKSKNEELFETWVKKFKAQKT
ncbi:40004_t:CDS:1, partial [Gigaspora margarita]